MDFVRDIRIIDGHIGQWTYAMDHVRNCRLIDGHNLIYGLMRWTMSAIFRLIDGHNLIYGLMRWNMSVIFVL